MVEMPTSLLRSREAAKHLRQVSRGGTRVAGCDVLQQYPTARRRVRSARALSVYSSRAALFQRCCCDNSLALPLASAPYGKGALAIGQHAPMRWHTIMSGTIAGMFAT